MKHALFVLLLSAISSAQVTAPGINATDRFNLAAQPFTISLPNSSTGTTVNKLAKAVTVAGVLQAQIITTSAADQAAVIGCVVSGAGTSGSALIVVVGTASCYFDAATTAGHIAVPSSTSAGALHDTGSTSSPSTGEVLATVGATNACGSPPCLVAGNLFMTPDLVAQGSQGNGGNNGGGPNKVTVQQLRRSCIIDNDTQSVTVLTTAQITGRCDAPAAAHLVEIRIRADTGTPSALLEKWHCSGFTAGTCTGYTKTDLLSATLPAATGGFNACATTTISQTCIDGSTSSGTITISTAVLAAGDIINVKSAVITGSPTWVHIEAIYTID